MNAKAKPDAVAKTSFKGVPDGEIHPVKFNSGDPLYGQLAADMIEAGLAKKPAAGGQSKAKADKAPANKAKGKAPTNKSGK